MTRRRARFHGRDCRRIVTSKSNLVLVGGEALLDVQGDELEKVPLNLDVDPLVVCADGDRLDVSVRDPAASRGTVAERCPSRAFIPTTLAIG